MNEQPVERDLFVARRLLADFYEETGRNGSSLTEVGGRPCRPAVGLLALADAALADATEALWQEAKRREAFLKSSPPRPTSSPLKASLPLVAPPAPGPNIHRRSCAPAATP